MTDIKTLALKYEGYTSLDKVYLDQLLAGKTDQEQLTHYTPPKCCFCLNFRTLSEKESPKAAGNYCRTLSGKLSLQY